MTQAHRELAQDLSSDSGPGSITMHSATRDPSAALRALCQTPPGCFVRCMHPMGTPAAAPTALLALLPSVVHQVPTEAFTLSLVAAEGHMALHEAWILAAQDPDRMATTVVPAAGSLIDIDGFAVDAEYLEIHLFDLIGVEEIDLIVATLQPVPAPEGELIRPAGEPTTSAFRLHMDARGTIAYVTPNVSSVLGVEAEDLIGTLGRSLVHPDDLDQSLSDWLAVLAAPDQPRPGRFRIRRGDDTWCWFEAVNWNALGDPSIQAVVTELRDVDARVRSEEVGLASSRAHERLIRVLDEVDDLVLVGRIDDGLVYWNRRAQQQLPGLRAGVPITDFMGVRLKTRALTEVKPQVLAMNRWTGDLDIKLTDGEWHVMATTVTPVLDSTSDEVFYGVVLRDVTVERRQAAALAEQARRDPLTGLPNRLGLAELLDGLAADGTRDVAVSFIDLDNFKVVNDGLGHGSGDRLLTCVTEALLAVAGTGTVTRFGGDEFVVVHPDVGGVEQAAEEAEHLLRAIRNVRMTDVPSRLSASIGVAWCPASEIDAEHLLKDADTAMYDAKRRGRGRVARFDQDQREAVTRRLVVETALQRAITDGDIGVHLQPVVSVADGSIGGFEALARWGLMSPTEFVTTAEESGLIVPLGERVLSEAITALRGLDAHLASAGPDSRNRIRPSFKMSVNVSGRELMEPDFARRTLDTVAAHGIDPGRLVLELTESILIDSSPDIDRALRTLRDAGVAIVLDDFGTGFSSLAYLRLHPIDGLKLDNSYTQSLLTGTDTAMIAEAIIGLAHRLGLSVVAEGVEDQAHHDALAALGIRWVQGFLHSPALPVEEILAGALGDLSRRLGHPAG